MYFEEFFESRPGITSSAKCTTCKKEIAFHKRRPPDIKPLSDGHVCRYFLEELMANPSMVILGKCRSCYNQVGTHERDPSKKGVTTAV